MDIGVGDFVLIDPVPPAQEVRRGIVRFAGATQFAEGPWMGVELVGSPGKNSGSVFDVHYFDCLPRQGVFVRPELVRVYASSTTVPMGSAPLEEKNAFDMDLRIELEELRDQVSSLTKNLEAKSLEVEELLLDKEIADEQRIAAETELEELRLNGPNHASSHSTTNLAEVVVALKHDNSKLQQTITHLQSQVKELEEEVQAANATESIVESLTTRNMELDEALTDARTILERILKERDGIQEVLSMQDEELRHQREDCESAQAALEAIRSSTEAQLHEMQVRLDNEQRAVAELDQKCFERKEQDHLDAVAAQWHSSMKDVSSAIAIVASHVGSGSNQSPCAAAVSITANVDLVARLNSSLPSTALAFLAQYEFGQLLLLAGKMLDGEAEFMTRLLEGLCAEKYTALRFINNEQDQSSSAEKPNAEDEHYRHTRSFPPLVLYCALVADVLVAIEWIRLDLLELTCRCAQLSHAHPDGLVLPWSVAEIAPMSAACKSMIHRVGDIHRIIVAFEPPAVDGKRLRESIQHVAVQAKQLRTAVLAVTKTQAMSHVEVTALPLQSSTARLSRLAQVATLLTSPQVESDPSIIALANFLNDAQNHARQVNSVSSELSLPLMMSSHHLQHFMLLWCACSVAFVSSMDTSHSDAEGLFASTMNAASTVGGDQIGLSVQWLLFGAATSYIFEGETDLVAGLRHGSTVLLGHSNLPLHLQAEYEDARNIGRNALLWKEIETMKKSCVSSTSHLQDSNLSYNVVLLSRLATAMLHQCGSVHRNIEPAADSNGQAANSPLPNDSSSVSTEVVTSEVYLRLQREKELADEKADEAVRQLWAAQSENQALSLIKADFKRIQGQLEAQEAIHRTNLKNVSQEYDSGISVLLQKNAKISSELRDAQRQKLQQVVSPMSLWERTQYQDALLAAQHHLALSSGISLRNYNFVEEWNPTKKGRGVTNEVDAAPIARKTLPRVFKFTSKFSIAAAREAVLTPKIGCVSS
ncbi:cytoskeleton-associated protein, putative [Bodo saltans]|uniref:Cytoskeleton-associated protein, putative n=1 Tax=Bodo saltans TaxID=75058 RepID=A0A0S4IX03_BODSA|nr:cytoskeleton-associated protein, putative [Bodo saltans]|eukprot:CUG34980.1 cytoskeleton-associated protein, putative [Bodo saltans]